MNLWNEPAMYKYLISVYWAFQTVTTVGFGDIAIYHQEEYILSIIWMLFGVSVYTLTIGNVSSIIANIDKQAFVLSEKLQTLQSYSLKIGLPPETAVRIQRFLENDSKDFNSLVEQENLVQELPPSLRSEVIEFSSSRIVAKLPFFKDKNIDFQHKVLPLLKARKLYRGDLLHSEGDLADEICFVLYGNFYIYKDISDMIPLPEKLIDKESQAFNVPFLKYGAGSYFGDEDCITEIDRENVPDTKKYYRETTAECVDDGEILVIKRRQMVDELEKFK